MLEKQVNLPTGGMDKSAKTRTVSLNDLFATQPRVTENGMDKQRDDSHGLPLVVQSNGIRYIQDGHHRLSKDKFDGKKEAKVRFVDLDKPAS